MMKYPKGWRYAGLRLELLREGESEDCCDKGKESVQKKENDSSWQTVCLKSVQKEKNLFHACL